MRGAVARHGIVRTLSFVWIALVILAAIFASLLPIPKPDALDPFRRLLLPGSAGHLLGTDDLGRDILSRLIYGARVSLIVGAASFVCGLIAGGAIGIVAGYAKGKVERVLMWAMDVILSFPALVLLIGLVAYVGRSLFDISAVLGFLAIPIYARIARAQTLSFTERDFVLAARASGSRPRDILLYELLPNVWPPMVAYGLVAVGLTIVVEGSLSFLGLSVSAPTPSWGGMIAGGENYLRNDPGLVLIPSAVMCLTVLAFNIAGEALGAKTSKVGRA
ncbi:MAG TPA: ABC transporter permease [Acidimicrobiales bacterium]|jgi:peptide/nickel transport system permease protein|nr:ABC transporter permease [Acidimicrobiales bacterium]